MPSIQEDLTAIRTAILGRDVRESIADGIEHCYTDGESAANQARDAATAANSAAATANAQAAQIPTLINQVQTATTLAVQAANDAASAANDAADAADDAADAANDAAGYATARGQAAQTAAQAANTAASNVADKVSAAESATSAANSAASSAAQAAYRAETATSSANSAAQTANSAAASANTAAAAANAAADAANAAAQAAEGGGGGLAFDSGYVDQNNYMHLTDDGSDIQGFTPFEIPIQPGGASFEGMSGYVDENNRLHLTIDGEDIEGYTPFVIPTGGGGGGGGATSDMTFTAADDIYEFTVLSGEDLVLEMSWSSTDDGVSTGYGRLSLTVNDVTKYSNRRVAQGTLREDITQYLSDGANTLMFTLTDSYGNTKRRPFTITMIDLRIRSSFDASQFFDGAILFSYMAYGDLEKTVHFSVDGTELPTQTVGTSGQESRYTIPAQSHGDHRLTVWFTATYNNETVSSNVLRYSIICTESGSNSTIIAVNYSTTTVDQYTNINWDYIVYSPNSQMSGLTISVGETVVQNLTDIDRTSHTFSYQMTESGEVPIAFASGNALKIIAVTVNEVEINVTPAVTEGLQLYFTSHGRSNQEANPAVWTSDVGGNTVNATFSGFNWKTDGWQLDEDGVTVMRVSGGGRITIPYQMFATDKRGTGFTFELEFGTRAVRNYDATIFSCKSGGRGIEMSSQAISMNSEQAGISMQFKEGEHVRIGFVVTKRNETRLIYCYVNGEASGVMQYPDSDNFAQSTPVGITIGSSDSTIDIYAIRVYDMDLTMQQMECNWIADTQNGLEMVARYQRNDIRNASGNIQIDKLPQNLPYMVITAEQLPQFKGDKKTCSGYFVNPANPSMNFTFTNCQIDVQGTSSQYYARKNYKQKYKSGFVNDEGTTSSKWAMNSKAIPTSTFCMKADVASSESANNVILAMLYNDICPYKTPGQLSNSKVRQGIEGFPCVIFWNNPTTNTTSFLGKYNFNNDKGTPEVFGFVNGDESWEIKNNTSNRVLFKDDDFVSTAMDDDGNVVPAWTLDFEARYPDTDPPYENYAQLKELLSWAKSTDTTTATGNALSSSVTYDGTTYTHDTAAYRLAKFKNELGNYVELNDTIFYYVFTEIFLMIDSRAKNAFPSFMGTPIGS